ncbi:IMPACT family protein [Halomarina salina]|uniref:IMPACT family protein n=1 Tax=Halomarina salina TaxID=1872699 RepID=A0ABD5RMG3_9EURY
MTESYRTLAGPGEAAFEIRGSEFVGRARPVPDIDTAEAFVDDVRAEYDDATHNVPAYRVREGDSTLGDGMLREYSSDDGEPSGSAGKPMLNVLQGQDLENVVVVVTRYYGGTNLGVGGLVRAYSRAVKESVAAAGVVEEVPHEPLRIVVDYDDSGTARGILESTGVEFEAAYEEQVAFDVRVPTADADALRERLRSATSGRVDLG